MKAYKEKQYLVFEFNDGKNVKYNLFNGETIGKSGKLVKNICAQLKEYNINTVIESFLDINYRNYLNFLNSNIINKQKSITNIGTFLNRINKYSHFEQYFAMGFYNLDVELKYRTNEIPKGVLKFCTTHDLKLTNSLVDQYKIHKDILNNIFNMELTSITHHDLTEILYPTRCYNRRGYSTQRFNDLVLQYNYKYDSLVKYIDNLMTYEAINSFSDILCELTDYARMMSALSNKYVKYPKNFLTTHKIACRNYNRLQQEFDEDRFLNVRNSNLEFTYNKYKIIYPKSIQSIKDEAVQQQNCLASYIQTVLDGECHIVFLREKDKIYNSLVTLEIRGMQVIQAKGKFNRDVTIEEQQIINEYNKMLCKLKDGGRKNVS